MISEWERVRGPEAGHVAGSGHRRPCEPFARPKKKHVPRPKGGVQYDYSRDSRVEAQV